MGSGLIYIIIVGMWIAYFLPRWIANHDEVSGRSVDKFNEAMRVVGRASGKTKVDLDELLRRKENQMLVRRIVFFSILGLMTIIALFILVGFCVQELDIVVDHGEGTVRAKLQER